MGVVLRWNRIGPRGGRFSQKMKGLVLRAEVEGIMAQRKWKKGGDSGGPLVTTQKPPSSIIKLVEQGNEQLEKK